MSRAISFSAEGWEGYLYWQAHDKRMLKKVNQLLKDCQRNPFRGIGKPEQLKHELSSMWSRRIDDEHRLVYVVSDTHIHIASCRYHY